MRLAVAILVACRAEPAATPPPVALPDSPDASRVIEAPPQRETEAHATLVMERSACFGSCPAYRIAVRDDGLVTYEGLGWVKKRGRVTRRVSPAVARDLIDRFRVVATIPLGTPKVVVTSSDMPSVRTVLETPDGRKTTLDHYTGDSRSPVEWTEFEDDVDRVLETAPFVSCGDVPCER